ncbi:hypothetical protein B0H11DRAFT_2307579, partial [Mycena galericulata]
MASFNLSELPNPLTPMAFLPPDIAYQVQITTYVFVGTLGAYLWDILSNLQSDYKLFTGRISLATVTYFFCRTFTLLYILGSAIFQSYPLIRCNLVQQLLNGCYFLAVPSNCLLFFLRVRAIFNRNPYLVAFFFCLWLGVLGAAATVPGAVKSTTIGPTSYCAISSAKSYIGISAIMPLVHDTTVFFAISLRLFGNTHASRGLRHNIKTFVTGEYLPHFSRALLKDGQLYYLSAVTVNLLVVIMFYNKAVSQVYRTMFTVPGLMVTNAMACLVFRNTKSGLQARIMTTSDMTDRSNSLPMI